jgi:Bacterial SH3 domain
MPKMRSNLHKISGRAVLLGILLAAGLAIAAPKIGSIVTVRVLTAKVMAMPRFIGKANGDVSRGQQLTVAEAKGDWIRVSGGATGWIHKTNLTERAVTLSSKPGGEGKGAASRDELELAGRGFTPQVEDQYRQKNPTLDFSHVDAIEKTEVDPGKLEAFLADGELSLGDDASETSETGETGETSDERGGAQ